MSWQSYELKIGAKKANKTLQNVTKTQLMYYVYFLNNLVVSIVKVLGYFLLKIYHLGLRNILQRLTPFCCLKYRTYKLFMYGHNFIKIIFMYYKLN